MSFRTISVRLTGNASSLNSALYQASRTIGDFGRSIERGAAGSLLRFGAVATVAGTAAYALERAFTASVRQAVAFDTAMRNVNSISGLSERALGGLGQQVLDLSTKVPQSATNLAGGLYQIASSGFQGAQGLTILKASAIAATAGLTDTATSAQVIVGALNAYGLQASDASKVSDELFQTVNLGVLTFNDLAQGMGDVVGTAAAAKVPLSDVGAAIATMTRAGVTPAESFTSLNRVLISILQPSTAMAAVLKSLGYQSGAAALQSKGLKGVIDELRTATGGSSQAMFQLFTDIRGARGALALMSNQGRTYNEVTRGFTDQTQIQGRALKTFNEQMKSVSAQWQLFKNRVSAVSIEAATHLLPAILSLIHSMTDLGRSAGHVFSDLAPFFTSLRNVGADVVTVFREMLSVATPLAKAIVGLAGGAAIATLNELGRIISDVTGFLARFRLAADVAAIVLLTRLIPALSVLAWKALSAVIVALDTALFGLASGVEGAAGGLRGLGSALLGLASPAALVSIALVGAAEAYSQFKQSTAQAKDQVKGLTAGFDILHPASAASQGALDSLNATLDRTSKSLSHGGVAGQALIGTLQVITPFTKNSTLNLADLNAQANKTYNTLIAQSTAARSAVSGLALSLGIPLMENENGPVGQLRALNDLAAQLNLGPALAAGGKVGEAALAQLKAAYLNLGKTAGVTTAQLGTLFDGDLAAAEAFGKAVQQAGDQAREAFGQAVDVISQFDPSSAAQSVKAAQDQLAQAQQRLNDLQAQGAGRGSAAAKKLADYEAVLASKKKVTVSEEQHLADLRAKAAAGGATSISQEQSLAKARRDIADATKGVVAAQDEAKKTGDLATIYRNDIAMGRRFVTEIQTAVQRGLDPQFVARLLKAGPEQAGPILDQLVADHSGRLIKLANSSETTLSQISAQAVRIAQFTATAINAPIAAQAQLAADLPKAIALQTQLFATGGKEGAAALARELHLSPAQLNRIAGEFGIILPKAIQRNLDNNPVTVRVAPLHITTDAAGRVHLGTKIASAEGGYIRGPGGPTSDSIPAWLSNGEYVIRASAVRAVGVPYLNAINRFADGGQVGSTAMPTIVRVVETPSQQHSTRNEWNVNVTSPDPKAFAEWAARQRRQKALRP